jgi:hypothetical protein
MEVELDVFSGRPNPVWQISAATAGDLLKRLQSSPPATGSLVVPDLGYRGFILRIEGNMFRVFNGQILTVGSGHSQARADKTGIESELAAQARAKGYGAALGGGSGSP